MQAHDMEYAGFWVRVGAALIDTLLIMAVTFPLLVALYGWEYFGAEQTALIAGPADFLISWVMPAVAVVVFWMTKQATPGKMALSLRVVDAATGNTLTAGQSIGRYLALLRFDAAPVSRDHLGGVRQEEAGLARQTGRHRGREIEAPWHGAGSFWLVRCPLTLCAKQPRNRGFFMRATQSPPAFSCSKTPSRPDSPAPTRRSPPPSGPPRGAPTAAA